MLDHQQHHRHQHHRQDPGLIPDPAPRAALISDGVHAYTHRIPTVLAIRYKTVADTDKVIAWVNQLREHGMLAASAGISVVAHDGLLIWHSNFERAYPGSVVVFDGRLFVLTEAEFDRRHRPVGPPDASGSA